MKGLRATVAVTLLLCCARTLGGVLGQLDFSFQPLPAPHGSANGTSFFATVAVLPDDTTIVGSRHYLQNGELDLKVRNPPSGAFVTSDGRIIGYAAGYSFLNQYHFTNSPTQPDFSIQVLPSIHAAVERGDGLLISGDFTNVAGVARSKIACLDSQLKVTPLFAGAEVDLDDVSTIAVQPDGKTLFGGSSDVINGIAKPTLLRFLADGRPDTSFTPVITNNAPSLWPPRSERITCIVAQPDGRILVGKAFQDISASPPSQVFLRLLPDGSLDTSFHTDQPVTSALLQSDGRIVCYGTDCFRLLADGSLDSSFPNLSASAVLAIDHRSNIYLRAFNAGGYLFTEGVIRVSSSGEVDYNYCPTGPLGNVRAIFPEVGGSVIVAGDFQSLPFSDWSTQRELARIYRGGRTIRSRFERDGIARLDRTGNLTNGFELPAGSYRSVLKMEKTDLGYIVFNQFDPRLARYTFDGALDPTFRPITASEMSSTSSGDETFAVQADGRILVAGLFFQFRGLGYPKIVRLNTDGSVDPTFRLTGNAVTPSILLPMPDGKIYSAFNGVLQRLGSDGMLDPTFSGLFNNLNMYVPATVQAMGTSLSDTFWVAGNLARFENLVSLNIYPVHSLIRLTSDEAIVVDSSAWDQWTQSMLVSLPGGGILTGSARINADGTIADLLAEKGSAVALGLHGDIFVGGGDLFVARLFGDSAATPLKLTPSSSLESLQLTGYPGSEATIEASEDLVHWNATTTLVLTNGIGSFDFGKISGQRFFRAQLR